MSIINSVEAFTISIYVIYIVSLQYVNSSSDLLPDFAVPSHYTIKLIIHMEEDNFTYDGKSYMDIELKTPSNFITLQAESLKIIGNVTLKNHKNVYETDNYSINKITHFLTIQFNETILEGFYQMHIEYKNQISDYLIGLTSHSYIDELNKKQWILMTNFSFFGAHRFFPCWDNPEIHTTFQISIKHYRKYTALSNTKFEKLVWEKNNVDQMWTHFKKTPIMSTYMLSFVLGKFKTIAIDNSVRVWSTKTTVDYEIEYMKTGQEAWEVLEDITDILGNEHLLEKLDFVVIPPTPDRRADVNRIYPSHNWGLCIVNEGDLKKSSYTVNLPKQLTYQWFINSIGPDNFHFKSFEHGLSVYLTAFIADKIDESGYWMDRFSFYCREKRDKYASIVRMIATLFGKERFQNALRSYILKNNFGEITSTTLINEFIEASKDIPVNFNKVLYNWKNTLGNPLITITRNYQSNTATITQSRFEGYSYIKRKEKYWIPIHCTNEDDFDFEDTDITYWFNPEINSLEIPTFSYDKWLICNKKQLAFYRVNYDYNNWELIIKYINSENYYRIHHLNRAQLIDDTCILAEYGYINYKITFNLLKYLKYETHFIPWDSFWKQLTRIHKSALPSSKFYAMFKAFVVMRTKNYERRFFLDNEPDDDQFMNKQRKNIIHWTCHFGLKSCQDYTSSKLTKWLEDPEKNSLPTNLKRVILCGGIRNADQNTWNRLWEKFNNDLSDEDSLTALGCSLNDKILQNFITKAAEDRFRNIYPWLLFNIIGGQSDIGVDVILDTINKNQTEYNEKYTRNYLIKAGVAEVIKRILTINQYRKLKKIIDTNSNIINKTEAVENLKIAEINVRKARKRFGAMNRFFEKTNIRELINILA